MSAGQESCGGIPEVGGWAGTTLCLLEGRIVANRKRTDPLRKVESSKLIQCLRCESYKWEQNAVSGKTNKTRLQPHFSRQSET